MIKVNIQYFGGRGSKMGGTAKTTAGGRTLEHITVNPNAALQPDAETDLNDVVKNPIPFVGVGEDMRIGQLLEDGTRQDKFIGSYDINVDDVQTLQSFVLESGIKDYKSWDNSEKPYVCLFEGKYYLLDGNHRMAKAKLKGQKKINVILSVRSRKNGG